MCASAKITPPFTRKGGSGESEEFISSVEFDEDWVRILTSGDETRVEETARQRFPILPRPPP